MSKKTPLEETFNLPSMEELTSEFSNEKIESQDDNEENDVDMSDYLSELTDGEWDEDDIDDPEELKKQIASTKRKIQELENHTRQYEHLKKYHRDVNEIHTTAMTKFDEIMTVALTMEANAGSKYLASATKLLDIALNAKNTAMDREIEMAKLQLRKEKQDHDMNKPKTKFVSSSDAHQDDAEEGSGDSEDDEAVVYDRNAILDEMSEKKRGT